MPKEGTEEVREGYNAKAQIEDVPKTVEYKRETGGRYKKNESSVGGQNLKTNKRVW
jgi:hypothetical protein